MTTGRRRWEHQHVSSSGAVALEELSKGLDHKSAPWPTAPWHAFRADDRCCSGRVFLQLSCLSLQRAFLDSLYFTRLFLNRGTGEEPRLRSSSGCYSDPTAWPDATLMVWAMQLHNAGFDMRAHAGWRKWGQKPLTPLSIQRKTSLSSVNLSGLVN